MHASIMEKVASVRPEETLVQERTSGWMLRRATVYRPSLPSKVAHQDVCNARHFRHAGNSWTDKSVPIPDVGVSRKRLLEYSNYAVTNMRAYTSVLRQLLPIKM